MALTGPAPPLLAKQSGPAAVLVAALAQLVPMPLA